MDKGHEPSDSEDISSDWGLLFQRDPREYVFFHLPKEAKRSNFRNVVFSSCLGFRTKGRVRKHNNFPECYTPFSEPFRFYLEVISHTILQSVPLSNFLFFCLFYLLFILIHRSEVKRFESRTIYCYCEFVTRCLAAFTLISVVTIAFLFDARVTREDYRAGNRRGAIRSTHTRRHLPWLLISIINKSARVRVCLSSTHRFASNQSLCLQVDLFIGRLVKAVIHSVPMALW
jgi:hypothetical protein